MTFTRLFFGKAGEDAAVESLKKLGYKILETNYRCSIGEVDIIAEEGGAIVFVEVKARTGEDFGAGIEGVDGRKQKKIISVAETYLSEKNLADAAVRFDVVSVTGKGPERNVEVVKDAFEAKG